MNDRQIVAGALAVLFALLVGYACGFARKGDKPPVYYYEASTPASIAICTNKGDGWTVRCRVMPQPQ